MLGWLNNLWLSMCSWSIGVIGSGIAATGMILQQLAIAAIMLGILLWMFRCTKVFRIGAITWLIGFILEILGSLMI